MLNATVTTFHHIGQTSGSNDKRALLSTLRNNQIAKEVLLYTYNPFITFGVTRKEPKADTNVGLEILQDSQWYTFKALLDLLSERKLTGGAAEKALTDFFASLSPAMVVWFCRILNKDLKIKIGDSTVLKEFPKLFPVFHPALCETFFEGCFVKGKKYLGEWKLDGYRAVCLVDHNSNARFFSREGNEFPNCNLFAEAIKASGIKDVMIDGEIKGKDWSETSRLFSPNMKKPPKIDNWQELLAEAKFNAFDTLSIGEWDTETCFNVLSQRKVTLFALVAHINSPRIVALDHEWVNNEEEAIALMEKYDKMGFEGAVFKDPDSKYSFRRTMDWIKSKNFWEDEFRITKWGYGDPLGAFADTFGQFYVSGVCFWKGKMYDVAETKVGGGYAVQLRDELLERCKKGELINTIAEVKFQEIQKNKEGIFKLRFPVYVRLREDKTVTNGESRVEEQQGTSAACE